ncbi:MAG: NADH-quinone oxidoreductase subunit NuoH [Acidimicrobiia bacterium]|nr:NADH-quinone oxidoreductase subunit NuoH [Acidimicrobiia bacterium]NNF69512.1 NADH-quinone oxidoreductase subunit NuoH [Acidimicrobiia bacterium]
MEVFIEAAIKSVIVFGLLLTVTIFLVWIERKVVADMQNRVGPNRAGPWGILQTVADGIKLIFKEPITPRMVQFGLYLAAPIAALIPALLIFLVIPIGRPFTLGDRVIDMAGTDLNIALLYILGFSSMAVYAVVLAGWSSGSKYPLLGAVRASAQMISYEAAMGLALVPVIIWTGSTSLTAIVTSQQAPFAVDWLPSWLPAWNLVLIPSFVIFFIAGVAETNRAPFDLVEAESEIVGGYHTEYSGFRFAMFFLAEYINIFNISALTVTLFLGGWDGPFFGPHFLQFWLLPPLYFLAKTLALVVVFVWIRASVPRMRYDQLMSFGWKQLIPVSLAWIVLFSVFQAIRQFGMPWA